MSRFNVNSNHPLIPNSQEYMIFRKYVSINSTDRDCIKYPNSSEFEIELPQDYLNVVSVKLDSWSFPANYSVFSLLSNNTLFTFKITNPYNPFVNGLSDPLQEEIYTALSINANENYIISIEEGFYTPNQMATELTNKMNQAVSNHILKYLISIGSTNINTFKENGLYSEFVIVYNIVGQKLWFGNRSCGFTITNTANTVIQKVNNGSYKNCLVNTIPDFSNWGLPPFLGFTRCNVDSF